MNDPSGSRLPPPIHQEQLRIGHICSILVRNLSLRPTRDRALQTLTSKRPGAQGDYHTTSDDADLTVSLTKSASNGKGKAGSIPTRRRSASWSKLSGSNDQSDDDTLATPSRSRTRNRQDATPHRTRPSASTFLSRSPYSYRRDALQEDVTEGDPSPRPILKRASTTRDGREGRYTDFLASISPGGGGASTSHMLGDFEATMLSRSDSRSSSRSSHTIRRPEHRSRTASMTSSGSHRSVRFDDHVSSSTDAKRSPRLAGRISDVSRLMLFSDKSLHLIMQERLLECYVELLSVPASVKGKAKAAPVAFYRTPTSKPGLHHSWGHQGGPPLAPERDFIDASDPLDLSPLEESRFNIRLWARPADADNTSVPEQKKETEWKMIWEKMLDLRDLRPIAGDVPEVTLSLPPNSLLLGLVPGANSLSGRDSLESAETGKGAADKGRDKRSPVQLSREEEEREAERTRRILENVVYYAVPLGGTEAVQDSEVQEWQGAMADRRHRGNSRSPARRNSGDGGYASDPEAVSSNTLISSETSGLNTQAPRADRRKAFLEQQRRVMELSLRETKMMPSYTLEKARILAKKQAELMQLLAEVHARESSESDLLSDPSCTIQLRLMHNEHRAKLAYLRSLCQEEQADLAARRKQLDERRARLEARQRALRESQALLAAEVEAHGGLEANNALLRQERGELSLQIHAEHASLLRDLEVIFPIELSDASSLLFSICGLPLPNAVSSTSSSELDKEEKRWKETIKQMPPNSRPIFHPFDDDTMSSALGLVGQLVILLSTYLSTPIHYPVATAGSRAVIQDCISLMSGPRAFPLYAKGMEAYRYEYAAFLLNKDIEQLMNVHSVTVIDIRHTLPNLKNLMVTVAAAPPTSHTTRKSHIGRNEIALRSTSATKSPLGADDGDAATSTAVRTPNGTPANKGKKSSGLGLGLPLLSKPLSGDETSTKNGEGPTETADTLVTTRILGSSKAAPPVQSGGTIESVARALSFFGGGARRS